MKKFFFLILITLISNLSYSSFNDFWEDAADRLENSYASFIQKVSHPAPLAEENPPTTPNISPLLIRQNFSGMMTDLISRPATMYHRVKWLCGEIAYILISMVRYPPILPSALSEYGLEVSDSSSSLFDSGEALDSDGEPYDEQLL